MEDGRTRVANNQLVPLKTNNIRMSHVYLNHTNKMHILQRNDAFKSLREFILVAVQLAKFRCSRHLKNGMVQDV
jgi:FtsP/CotA-like multicopper oxidase with cupredoxin domain